MVPGKGAAAGLFAGAAVVLGLHPLPSRSQTLHPRSGSRALPELGQDFPYKLAVTVLA
jgi:hypothetical protein